MLKTCTKKGRSFFLTFCCGLQMLLSVSNKDSLLITFFFLHIRTARLSFNLFGGFTNYKTTNDDSLWSNRRLRHTVHILSS